MLGWGGSSSFGAASPGQNMAISLSPVQERPQETSLRQRSLPPGPRGGRCMQLVLFTILLFCFCKLFPLVSWKGPLNRHLEGGCIQSLKNNQPDDTEQPFLSHS